MKIFLTKDCIKIKTIFLFALIFPWMLCANFSGLILDQLNEEFAPFQQRGISQQDLDKCFDLCLKNMGAQINSRNFMIRFRVINGQIFFKKENDDFFSRVTSVANTLKLLQKREQLPNLDFIMCYNDATPCGITMRELFWMTDEDYIQKHPKAPVFVITKPKGNRGLGLVLVPHPISLNNYSGNIKAAHKGNRRYSWPTKKSLAFWVGTPTDLVYPDYENEDPELIREIYQCRPRFKVCELAKKYPTLVVAGFNHNDFPVLNSLISDMMTKKYSIPEQVKYKYLVNLDGWGSTDGYIWRLASNSVIFKAESLTMAWYDAGLQPFVHYVPIRRDLSDLIGKIFWAQDHDQLCQQMAQNATQYTTENISTEKALQYWGLVLQKHAKIQNFDAEKLETETKNDPSWRFLGNK